MQIKSGGKTVVIASPDPVRVQAAELGGEVVLSWMTLGSIADAQKLIKKRTSARGIVAGTLHLHLLEPSLDLQAFRSLSDATLYRIAAEWARSPNTLDVELSEGDFPNNFVAALQELPAKIGRDLSTSLHGLTLAVSDQQKRLLDIAAPSVAVTRMLESALGVSETAKSILAAYPSFESERTRRAMQAAFDTSRLTETLESITKSFGKDVFNLRPSIEFVNAAHLSQLKAALDGVSIEGHILATSRMFEKTFALHSEFAGMAKLAEQALSIRSAIGRDLEAIGKISQPQFRILDSLDSLSSITRNLWATWETSPSSYSIIPPSLRTAPTRELYESSAATDALVRGQSESATDAERRQRAAPEIELEFVEQMLFDVGPDLLKPYRGALAVLDRGEADYVRHFAVSLRELLTHLLHRLASDEEVRKWTSRAEDYHKGRPTRAARLRFILRGQMGDEFADWVDQDVKMAIGLIEYLHGGTHRMGDDMPVSQLRWVQRRVEAVVIMIIEASRAH
jgi:hypothetical protein